MDMTQAKAWLEKLDKAVAENKISQMGAWEEVFAEMETGDHDAAVETLFYNYTQKP